MHGKMLIAYFSASPSRRTATVAHKIADVIGADLHEIMPAVPYTQDDLNWNDHSSRSSVEMRDPNSRPEIAETPLDLAPYGVIFIGFPIWWYKAPHIINTFLESYDLTGKTIVPFATSGGSAMGQTVVYLRPSAEGAVVKEGRRFEMGETPMAINSWIAALGI
ncbi:flavodoxin [Selenomonas timonae]|uniref:Flavodoxin n=1 Tax=Selenomonas timonae TaxID=2754044 RepID=A0A7G7VH75_9FIRM|nr:flavodoxin [Selenomonas timonae]QNH53468.1 flavodoxin [Selenomonas timonae]